MLAHTARGALHVAAALFAVGATIVAVLFVLVGGQGIGFGPIHETIERRIAEKTGAEAVTIGDLRLVRDQRGDDPFKITITDFTLDQGDGNIVSLPSVSVRMSGPALTKGRALPTFIEIEGATFAIKRRGDDVLVDSSFDLGALLRLAGQFSRVGGAGFRGARLEDFTFSYEDLEAGTRFRAVGGTASLRETAGDYDFRLVLPFPARPERPAGEMTLAADTDMAKGRVDVVLSLDNAPTEELLSVVLAGDGQLAFEAPVSGRVTAGGSLRSGLSDLDISLDMGAGAMHYRGTDIPIAGLSLRGAHNITDHMLRIDRLDYAVAASRGHLEGNLEYETDEGAISALLFDLEGRNVVTGLEGLLEKPLPLETLSLKGGYGLADRRLDVQAITATYFGTTLTGDAEVDFPTSEGVFPGIRAHLDLDGTLGVREVLRGWPVPAADGARRWVVDFLPDGRVSEVALDMDVPLGGISPEGLAPDAVINLDFRVDDATVIYVPGMTPLTDLSASARIEGNSFHVDAEHGQVGPIRLTGGGIEMPRLAPKGAMATYRVKVAGELEDMLSLLDEPPLGYVSMAGIEPGAFSGQGHFDLKIGRPMLVDVPLDDYRFTGAGGFSRLGLTLFDDLVTLSSGSGTVTLENDGLTVSGLAEAAGVPSSFEWYRPFGDDIRQTLTAETRISPRAADAFGIPLRRFMRGEALARIEGSGDMKGFDRFDIAVDLTPATLVLEDGKLLKSQGTPGDVTMRVEMPGDVPLTLVPSLTVTTPGADILGSARFTETGGLVELDLPRIFIEDIADFGFRLTRGGRRLKLAVSGNYLDLSGFIDRFFKTREDSGPLPGGVDLDVALDRLALKGGAELEEVRVSGHHDGAQMAQLTGTGRFPGGGTLDLRLRPDSRGLGKAIDLHTDRFDMLMRGLFGIESVFGGQARVSATMIDEGPVAGQFTATDIVIRNAPIIARLLSIGSLDGLENILNGEGLEFEEVSGDIQIENGQINLVDARMTGSALGLSANGVIDIRDSAFALHGAVAPAYRVNSLIGEVPGLGNLFVSRKGEGVFAMTYRITGPMNQATIEVNTLAALTPGIFRRIFEPIGKDLPSTAELLTAAEDAAGDVAARDFLSTPELLQEYERERAAQREGLQQN